MGLEAYVPVNPIAATTRTCILPATKHHFSYRKKHVLPTCGGLKMTTPSPTTSSVAYSSAGRAHRSGIVCEAKTDEVVVVTDASWKNLVIGSQTPVLVEFWAPWCGPCRMIAPVIDELAKEYAGKIACFKLNTDDSPSIATEYGIRSIPTVLFFKNGEKKESVIGAVPKTTLVSTIDKYLDA